MPDETSNIGLFLDLLPNQPKNKESRDSFAQIFKSRFGDQLPSMVERVWELPPIILKQPFGEYLSLLTETRELFLAAHFYSCVAMCGIVCERLIKDVLKASIFVRKDGNIISPSDTAFDQLERVDISGIIRFLEKAMLLSPEASKVAQSLGELRNRYAHARGKDPQKDAQEAIRLLHAVIEDTVSVFKDFEIKDGVFSRKPSTLNR